jgi:hypothetical protein
MHVYITYFLQAKTIVRQVLQAISDVVFEKITIPKDTTSNK